MTSRPDRGYPTLHGWWPPVALCYKERWGPAALSTRFTVSRHTHQQIQSDLVRGAASDGKLHCRLHRRLCTTAALLLTSTPSPRHRRPGPHHLRHDYVELFLQARGWSVTSHLPSSLSLDHVLGSFYPVCKVVPARSMSRGSTMSITICCFSFKDD